MAIFGHYFRNNLQRSVSRAQRLFISLGESVNFIPDPQRSAAYGTAALSPVAGLLILTASYLISVKYHLLAQEAPSELLL